MFGRGSFRHEAGSWFRSRSRAALSRSQYARRRSSIIAGGMSAPGARCFSFRRDSDRGAVSTAVGDGRGQRHARFVLGRRRPSRPGGRSRGGEAGGGGGGRERGHKGGGGA